MPNPADLIYCLIKGHNLEGGLMSVVYKLLSSYKILYSLRINMGEGIQKDVCNLVNSEGSPDPVVPSLRY